MKLAAVTGTARRRSGAASSQRIARADATPRATTVDDLLTAWVSTARGLRGPDTLDDCADYSRYLDEVNRAIREADALCRCLRERLARWATEEVRLRGGATH
jgi:hypothetical protein